MSLIEPAQVSSGMNGGDTEREESIRSREPDKFPRLIPFSGHGLVGSAAAFPGRPRVPGLILGEAVFLHSRTESGT